MFINNYNHDIIEGIDIILQFQQLTTAEESVSTLNVRVEPQDIKFVSETSESLTIRH